MAFEIIDGPPEAVVKTIPLRAFATSPPELFGLHRLEPDGRALLDAVWRRGVFPPAEAQVIRLKNAYAVHEGLVFDEQLRVIRASITQHSKEEIKRQKARLVEAIARGALTRREGCSVLCIKPGLGNYGHWLVEMLPKAEVAERLLGAEQPSFLVPDLQGPMRLVYQQSMAMLGIDSSRLFHVLPEPEFFADLVIVTGLTSHGQYMAPLVFETLEKIAEPVAPLQGYEKLYVRRKAPANRTPEGEDAITSALAEQGYRIVSPEEHSLAEQIAMFKAAEQVIGVSGAALTNIAFCRPGTEVVIFYPANMLDTFYWFIAQHRGLKLIDVRCEQLGPSKSHMPWDTDIRIDPVVLARLTRVRTPRLQNIY